MHQMRRTDRQTTLPDAVALLKTGEYGFLATVGADGQPYGVPLSFVYLNDSIYIHCATAGHKLVNIHNHSKVSFCVVGRTEVLPEQFATKYESAIAFGSAAEVYGQERRVALMALLEKYSPAFMEAGEAYMQKHDRTTVVIKITINHLSGKARR